MQNNRNDQVEQLHQSGKDYLLSPPHSIPQAILQASKLIADAIHANAEATVLLARATAGEFEPGDEPQGQQYLDGAAG